LIVGIKTIYQINQLQKIFLLIPKNQLKI